MNYDKNRVLVTGGSGYIGAALVTKLLQEGYFVNVLDSHRLAEFEPNYNCPMLNFIEGDLRKDKDIYKGLRDVKAIIHLAAVSDGRSGKKNPDLTKLINYECFQSIINKAKESGVQRFIFASTFGVYGSEYKQPLTEDLKLRPEDPYSKSKAMSEILAKDLNSDIFVTTGLRFAMVCGWSPAMRFDLIVNYLTRKALTEKSIVIMGGEQKRPQIHINDIVEYFIDLLKAPKSKIGGEIFNAGGQNVSIMEIAETIRTCINGNLRIYRMAARKDECSYVLDSSKIANVLKLTPRYFLADAVNDIIHSYR